MAVLVILLLLVLFVPWACQALLGSGDDLGSGSSDTVDVDSSGGNDEGTTTDGDTAGDTEVADQESATKSSSEDSESGSRDTASRASSNDVEDSDHDLKVVEGDGCSAKAESSATVKPRKQQSE